MGYVRTQSATELLGNTCSLYGKHFVRLIAAFGLIGLPVFLIQNVLGTMGGMSLILISYVIGVAGMALAYGALITTASEICVGVMPNLGRAYGRMLRYAVPLLIAGILQLLAIATGMVLLIVPGIIAAVFLMFVAPVVVLERKSALAAMRRSWQLSRQFFWRNLGLLAVVSVSSAIIGGILGGIVGFIIAVMEMTPQQTGLLFGLMMSVLYTLIIPASLLLTILMYYDLRARKEGYDPAQLTQELQY